MRILFLSSNPEPKSPLAVDKEFNRVKEKLGGMDPSWARGIDHWPDIRLDQLPARLIEHRPAIVHFSGHGLPGGALYMRDQDGRPAQMHPEGLSGLFSVFRASVRLVVLNACYADKLAVRLVEHIDAAVGMSTPVSDDAAMLFAPALYECLAGGLSVADAMTAATALIAARYPEERETPRLRARAGVDPAKMFFGGRAARDPRQDADEAARLVAILRGLPAGKFEEVLFGYGDSGHVPGKHAPQVERAIELVKLARSAGRLEALARVVEETGA